MNNEQLLRELEEKKRQSRSMQKKIIVCIMAVAILCAVFGGVMAVALSGWFVTVEHKEASGGFVLYPMVDYEYNIMEDAAYLRLLSDEPFIKYCDNDTRIEESLSEDLYDDRGDAVKRIIDMVLAIQAGDHEAYYSFFTDAFLDVERAARLEQGLPAEHEFTMQQVYAVVITKISEEKNPQTGVETCIYRLKYKIHKNNGTFRTDLDSDSYHEQELVMVNSESDPELKINSVSTEKTIHQNTIIHGWRIALVAVASLVIASLTVVGMVIILKKLGNVTKEEIKK